MNSNYILAVHSGHNASAALMRDGEILAAIQEERFSRKKNHIGFPKNAINFCLKTAKISGINLCRIAYTTKEDSGLLNKAQVSTAFSLRDYHEYYGSRFYGRKIRNEDVVDYYRWLRDDPKFNNEEQLIDYSYLENDEMLANPEKESLRYRKEQSKALSAFLNVPESRIEHLDHHTNHASYAYFGSPFRGKDCIVITLDGWGDGRNQTVWKVHDEHMCLLAESGQNDIGRVYKMATLILGMRPDEHEFKVMGLAAYAKSSYIMKTFKTIEKISKIEGMKIVENERPRDIYAYLRNAWIDHRFDNIAGAVQYWTEELVKQLVINVHKETGISRFVLSGGISMNVKMNKVVGELDCVSELYICGSGGDESLSIGGCYFMNQGSRQNKPLRDLYLGYDISDDIDHFDWGVAAKKFRIEKSISHNRVAELLASGETVAVIRGRCEFGARALGNRSILADPSRKEAVIKINEAIKNRDFWMPFALSILEEQHKNYIKNPKNFASPFMATAFETKPELYKQIEAGTHPYDKTVRPQFVNSEYAPQYHSLISSFYKLTGIPALLNTSFNLHGEPIVNTICDAVRTFELSGLDHLLVDDQILLSKT